MRRVLAILALLSMVLAIGRPASAAVAYVQSNCTANSASAASVSVTLGGTVTSGNTVVFLGLWSAATDTTTGATDDKSNTFTAGTALVDPGGNGFSAKPYYLQNITNAPITFTINLSGAVTYHSMCAMEISGIDTATPLRTSTQQAQNGIGTGTDAVTSGTTGANATTGDFVWGGTVNTFDWFDGTTYFTAGTGYTKPVGAAGGAGSASLYPIAVEYKTAGSTAAVAATFTHGVGTDDAGTFVIAFRAAAGGGSPACVPTLSTLGVSQCG